MFRKALTLTAIVLVFGACELQAAVIDSNWVGGESGEWGNASNWSPAIVPDNGGGNTFFVTINSNYAGVDEVEVGLRQSWDVNTLDCYGVVRLESWRWYLPDVTVENGLTNHGSLALEVNIRGNVTNTAGAELEMGEHLNIYGNLYNNLGAIISIWRDDIDIEGDMVQNAGLIFVSEGGNIGEELQFNNTGEIRLFRGGCHGVIFDNNSVGIIEGSGRISSNQLTRNKGAIYASGGPLMLYSDGSIINTGTLVSRAGASLNVVLNWMSPIEANIPDVNNQGTIEINSSGVVTFNSDLRNEPNAVINLRGGTLEAPTITQSADANFAGFGSITGDILIESSAKIELTGPTNIVGDVNIPANATLEVSDGTTLITGQTTCNNGTIHMIGGRVICQGGLTNNNCHIIWEPGIYTNVADFNLDGTVNFKDFADFANTWLWQADWYTP